MPLLLAKDFTKSIAPFTHDEKAAVWDFVTLFQENPEHPSLRLERLNGAASDLWSARINRDLRAILHKHEDSWFVLRAGHHQDAYRWAERRHVGRHPVTGVLQIVETVETVETVEPPEVHAHGIHATHEAPLFEGHREAYLLSLGVPDALLPWLREVRSDAQLFEGLPRLPEDVQDRLVALAAGELPPPPAPVTADRMIADSPDLRRRFFVLERDEELRGLLEAPLAEWLAFLHPSQRRLAEGTFTGAVKVSGAAGTGKTVVGLHRARHLARQGHRVLLTTFTNTLTRNLERSLDLLCPPEERARVTVSTVHHAALTLAKAGGYDPTPINDNDLRALVDEVLEAPALPADPDFLRTEWDHVVQPQGLLTWEEYRDARRTGRGRRLSEGERALIWPVFHAVRARLADEGLADWPTICRRAERALREGMAASPWDAVVVDEVQDLKAPDLRFVAALAKGREERLMLLGDAGQRIYSGGYSLSALDIDVRGRAHVLRINYRTTEQIRRAADRVLGEAVDDLDAGTESRAGTRSLLAGPQPVLQGFATPEDEVAGVVARLQAWLEEGLAPGEMAVVARRNQRVKALREAAEAAGLPCRRLASETDGEAAIGFGTMHGAKGLEFKAVLVASCAKGYLPLHSVVKRETEPADREAARARERALLYVAMTRARDELAITWAKKPSPFLEGLLEAGER